jgi:hypothetical protein
MTCAGTLGLAVGHGAAVDIAKDKNRKPPDISKDIHLRAALVAIGSSIDHPVAKRGGRPAIIGHGAKGYYFLWSLERVCVALDLEKISGKDWYTWGAEILVVNQRADGMWLGDYAQGGGEDTADTCFALLFLRRANLARDLTARLKGKLDQRVLQAGGVGGDALKGGTPGLKPALDPDAKPNPDSKPSTDNKLPVPPDTRPPSTEVKNPPPDKPPVPPTTPDSPSGRLTKELVQAGPGDQDRVLREVREGKGSQYTEALAAAIPQMTGDGKRKARDALADRLARMKPDTLSKYLQDEDAEIRRASALACAMKELKAFVPQLIDLLADPEALVGRAAHAALKELTGKDFGPAAGADRAEVQKAMTAWKDWWAKEGKN